jgi:hypothetical protein
MTSRARSSCSYPNLCCQLVRKSRTSRPFNSHSRTRLATRRQRLGLPERPPDLLELFMLNAYNLGMQLTSRPSFLTAKQARPPAFEKVPFEDAASILWKHVTARRFRFVYHYHPEIELIYFAQGGSQSSASVDQRREMPLCRNLRDSV